MPEFPIGRMSIAVLAVGALAGGYAYFGTSADPVSGLRTATVSTATIEQTTTLTGTVERTDQVSVSFPTSATVTSVKVGVGDTVTAGQVLATEDTAGLQGAVTSAQANLVAAQAALSDTSTTSAAGAASTGNTTALGSGTARAGATTPASPAPTSSPAPASSAPGRGAGTGASGGGASGSVDTAPLTSAEQRTRQLITAAQNSCASLTTVQPPSSPPTTTQPTPTTTTTTPSPSATSSAPAPTSPTTADTTAATTPPTGTTPSTGATPTTGSTTVPTTAPAPEPTGSAPTADQIAACVDALGSALAATQQNSTLISSLAKQLDDAATALQKQSATQSASATQRTGGSPSAPAGGTTGGASGGTGGATGAGAGGAGQAGGADSTAAKEVALLKAQQELATAQQALDGATLKAPLAGIVGALGLTVGQPAGAGTITIVGAGTAVVTAAVPLAQLGRVRVGQSVSVVPAGTTDSLTGAVLSIGVLPESTTTTTPTYPVRIAVGSAPNAMASGSTASATITLASVEQALAVPVSALAGITGSTGEVTVLSGQTSTRTQVAIGAIGQGRAQITQGLSAGQQVVIADATQPLPAATSQVGGRIGGGTGGGGFRGTTGGGAPAGAPAGPPPGN